MKCNRPILVCLAALVFTTTVFAKAHETINCPSLTMVKKSVFTQAKYNDFLGWDMTSNSFEYQGKEWNTLFGTAILDDDLNAYEALNRGQNIFNSLALKEPTQKIRRNITICTYLFTDQVVVVTTSPAINLENSSFINLN